MKINNKIYDYSKLRPSTITSPQYRHLLLLLGWVWYLTMYFITENLIPESSCHVVHSVVDDIIPFNEYFVLAYVAWYFYLVFSLGYFMFFDIESFKRLQTYLIVTQVIAMITYVIWPSIQLLRPEQFDHNNFCTWILGLIYSADTPTGVCPSLHVAYSLGIASTWRKRKNTSVFIKVFIIALAILICFSVMFVKQHSFVDVVAALFVGIVAEGIAFGRHYWMPLFKRLKEKRI